MTQRFNPYHHLKKEFSEFVDKVLLRRRVSMWRYTRERLQEKAHNLDALYQRVQAAQQLGYTVELLADDEGLRVEYVQKLPTRPWGV